MSLGKAFGMAEEFTPVAGGKVPPLGAPFLCPELELGDVVGAGAGLVFFGAGSVGAGTAGQAPTTPGLKMPSSGGGPNSGSNPVLP